MKWFLQMCRAKVFTAYHTITQDAYGRSVAYHKIAEPHWFVHSARLLHIHENEQEVDSV
jgi:hypothetical protein